MIERIKIDELVEGIGLPFLIADPDENRIVYANQKAADLFGLPLEELIGSAGINAYVDPVDEVSVREQVSAGGAIRDREVRFRRTSGEIFWALVNVESVWDSARRRLFVATIKDITPQKEATERAREVMLEDHERAMASLVERLAWERSLSRQRNALLLKRMSAMAYLRKGDEVLTMLSVSEGCVEVTGYEVKEILGSTGPEYLALVHEDDRAWVERAYREALAERRSIQIEYRIRAKGGALRWVWDQGEVYLASNEVDWMIEGVVQDITERFEVRAERERLEQKAAASQRMEALGRFTGNIAHDFNNLLAVIQTYAGFLREEAGGEGSQAEDADVILDAARRATSLTRQLLAFSRQGPQALATVDLNAVMAEMSKMLGRVVGSDVTLSLSLEREPCKVRLDATQIEQVLMNLAVNARDAMPDGGTLTFETAKVRIGEALEEQDLPLGDYVRLSVRDTGMGMSEETQLRVFEPFFSTKEKDKGTGLGLSTVFGIIKQCRGHINLKSAPGEGSTFELFWPLVEVDDLGDGGQLLPQDLDGVEKILILKRGDLEMARAIGRALKGKGYSVLKVADAVEAREALAGDLAGVDVLIVDLGPAALVDLEGIKEVRARRPELGLVFLVDGVEVHIGANGPFAGAAVLPKPFTTMQILERVRLVLNERQAARLSS